MLMELTATGVINTIATWFAILSLIPIGLFVFYYGTKPAPEKWYKRRYSNLWKSTKIGVVLMYQKIAWFVFYVFVTVNLLAPPEYAGKDIFRVVIYGSLLALFWAVFRVLRQVQLEAEKIKSELEEAQRVIAEQEYDRNR